ncbi:MAG: TadE/TadG family type IV pilus assembly protein [Chromatiaceae bacterium]|jgi:Flp pilus assembly protein TadG
MMRIFSPHQYKDEHGGAIVEFALIASFLILLLMVTFDYGRIFFTSMGITSAANGLALYANKNSVNGAIPVELTTDVKAQALAQTLSPDVTGLSAKKAVRTCRCPPATNYTACQDPLPTCANGWRIAIEVTAAAEFRTVVNYPGIPNKTIIERKAIIRVQ